jgi:Zn-dependent protease
MTMVFSFDPRDYGKFFEFLPAAFICVFIAYMARHVAFKRTAARYGAQVFYKTWPFGVVVSLIAMLVPPFKLVVPGAVVVFSQRFAKWKRRFEKYSEFTEITMKQAGIIAVSGPFANIILALAGWGIMAVFFPGNTFLILFTLVNSWMALSSLIPINPLEGGKVFMWKPWLWLILLVVSAIFLLNSSPFFFK